MATTKETASEAWFKLPIEERRDVLVLLESRVTSEMREAARFMGLGKPEAAERCKRSARVMGAAVDLLAEP